MNKAATILKTLKVRIKDKHATLLKQWAFECNQVWNEANAITADFSYVPVQKWVLSETTFQPLTLPKAKPLSEKPVDLLFTRKPFKKLQKHTPRHVSNSRKTNCAGACLAVAAAHLGGFPLNPVQPFGKMDKSAITVISSRYGIATD